MKSSLLIGAAFAVLTAAPASLVATAAFVGTTASTASASVAAAAACAYAYPDTDRIVAAIETLTDEPVTAAHWEEHAPNAGMYNRHPDGTATPIRYEASTPEQRRQVLTFAVRDTIAAESTISAPAIAWWLGRLPTEHDTEAVLDTHIVALNTTLADYLPRYLDAYLAVDVDDDHTCVPAHLSTCPQPFDMDAALATIRHLESGNDYTQASHAIANGGAPGTGHPSGAYQYLASSWNNHAGYPEAFLAPPALQDERARNDVIAIIDTYGDPAWIPISWYIGPTGAAQIAAGDRDPHTIPNPAHNTLTPAEYQARWMEHYTTIALPIAGIAPNDCPQGATAVIAWAETQLGAPYIAANPYRFGTPTPSEPFTGFRDDTYTFPAGTVGYDCSGFVIAAWRTAGIDLTDLGLYGSQTIGASNQLVDVERHEILPGDLAVYAPNDNGVGHIVMIHHTDDTGTVHTIEAAASRGVTIDTIDWQRVTAIKRPG